MIITYEFVHNLLVEQYKNSITDSVIILLKTPLEWKKKEQFKFVVQTLTKQVGKVQRV